MLIFVAKTHFLCSKFEIAKINFLSVPVEILRNMDKKEGWKKYLIAFEPLTFVLIILLNEKPKRNWNKRED